MKEKPYQPFHGFFAVEHVNGSHDGDKEVGKPCDHGDGGTVQDREHILCEVLEDACQVGFGVLQPIQQRMHIDLREALLQLLHKIYQLGVGCGQEVDELSDILNDFRHDPEDQSDHQSQRNKIDDQHRDDHGNIRL